MKEAADLKRPFLWEYVTFTTHEYFKIFHPNHRCPFLLGRL
jgi:hypothetical protein